MKNIRLLVAFILICFVFSPKMQAVRPEPNEADLTGNMAEEDDAISDPGSDIEAAAGQLVIKPNQKVLQIKNLQKSLQCVGGNVKLSFKVLVTFKQRYAGVVLPHSIKFLGFTGTAVAGGRKLEAKKLTFRRDEERVDKDNKSGRFTFDFEVTGLGLPVSSPFRLFVR